MGPEDDKRAKINKPVNNDGGIDLSKELTNLAPGVRAGIQVTNEWSLLVGPKGISLVTPQTLAQLEASLQRYPKEYRPTFDDRLGTEPGQPLRAAPTGDRYFASRHTTDCIAPIRVLNYRATQEERLTHFFSGSLS